MFQLSFLNAGLLIFAAATLLPLIIWLLAKKKPRQILFSSLKFIKLSQQQEKSRTRITNIILLIIRMLIILLVALAVARPMLASSRFAKSDKHPPTALGLILDTSYSMDYIEERQTRIDKSLKAIQSINAIATEADRLILISRDAIWNDLHAQIYAGAIPEEIMRSVSLSWEPMSWEETFAFAEAKLTESQMPNREIYLLSDFVNEEISVKSQYPLAAIPISELEPRQNLSVSEARVLPQIVGRGKQQTLEFRLTNHGNQDRDEILIQAVLDEVKVAERFVSIPARQSLKEEISFEIRSEGWQSGYIEVLDEHLGADNRAYFAFEYFQHPRVAVVGTQPLPLHLASILQVYTGGIKPDLIHPSNLNRQMLDDYKVFIFYEFGELTPRLREMILELDSRQTGSLFCLGQSLAPDAKSFLNQRFSLNLGERKQDKISIDFISPHHHPTALIADKDLRFPQISSYWQSSAHSSSLISAAQYPLAVNNPKSALWLWDISASSAFFTDPAFAVFAYRQISALQSASVPMAELKVGDSIRASELMLPSLDKLSLAYPHYITHEPGIYVVNPSLENPARIAVNIEYNDSDPLRVQPKTKLKMLSEDFTQEVFMSRLGRDLWKLLLAIALALMILEIIIVKSQEHKSQYRSNT
ncbi:MAG: BatA domain-containing protein [Candidatus Cloacimonetes bacterium]|jgi:hypothetical protein|nr:BatA domain-containing protein [Candidatus Cloacimonadota bacterium]MCB5286520.1 BatA domain-containing protein [Candidatus Cloacimonadota bacterium]MCK9185144.1 BatA domain-containing protein [Candidatus Cloacimonadota bacterium]MDY0228842.1 BatA domain-containing protein [Candidatus Cloacimonadaceae bacterium]